MKIITYKNVALDNIAFIDKAKADLFITASKSVIEKWVRKLDESIKENRRMKRYFMQNNNDFASGTFLYSHCMLSAIKSIYLAFKYIKSDEGGKSWMLFVDASDYLDVARLFLDKFRMNSAGHEHFVGFLKALENSIFPTNQLFVSPGAKETLGDCSVCGEDFFDCEHIERDIYNGVLCQRVNKRIIEANHIALVKNPRDRRCVIRTIESKDGSVLDVFSRERTLSKGSESDHMIINVILHSFQRPIFD